MGGMTAAVDRFRRFVTLAREAPGYVAVQRGGGGDSSDSDSDWNEGLGGCDWLWRST